MSLEARRGAASTALQARGEAPTYSASPGRVLLLVFAALLVLTQLYAAIPLVASVAVQLGGNMTFALSTVFGLCYALGFLVWGPLADLHGNKRVMVVGLVALTVFAFACAFAPTVALLAVSRAPLAEIERYRQRMGWRFKWVSSYGSDFNFDYGVSFPPEKSDAPNYNFGTVRFGDAVRCAGRDARQRARAAGPAVGAGCTQ